MKRNFKKVLASFATAAYIFTSSISAYGQVYLPTSIYEYKAEENLSSGVKHEHIQRFTTAGWWNMNVLRVDLSDQYTDVKGIYNPEGLHKRGTVSSLVEKNGAIAGINGDYFNYKPLPSSLGTLINDGEIISSPIEKAYALPSVYIDNNDTAHLDFMDRYIEVKNTSKNDHYVYVNMVNKLSDGISTVTMLNKHWGPKSLGNTHYNDVFEVVVQNERVIDVRSGQAPVNIPKNGYVLLIRGDHDQGLRTFTVGDEVKLTMRTTPNNEKIKFAIGGGSMILKDGQTTLTNIHSSGNHPRTGIGISQDGSELILVTIDGRDSSFKGVGQELFGAILKDLGAYNGMNLDGGGSTTMAIKSIGDDKVRLANKPSDGGQRAVVNGVGLFSNAPKGELSYLEITTDDYKMFVNTSRNLDVKGYDQFHNPVNVDKSLVSYEVSPEDGEIIGNKFIARKEGNPKIKVNYGETPMGEKSLKVLGEVRDIETEENNINLDINSERKLSDFYGRDRHGYIAKIYSEDLEFEIHQGIGHVENGIFYSGPNTGAGAITARIGSGLENIIVSVGSNASLIEGFESIDNLNFSSYPANVTGSIYSSIESKEGGRSIGLRYNIPAGEQNRAAYINFSDKGIKLQGLPKRIGIWVKGDGSNTWLRGSISDSNNTQHTIDFAKKIDWNDWRYVTAEIPGNVSYPINLERIYVVETDPTKALNSEILIDGLTANYPPTVGTLPLPTPSSLVDEKNTKSQPVENGYTMVAGFDPIGLNELVGYDARTKLLNKFNENNLSIVLGNTSKEFNDRLKTESRIHGHTSYGKNVRGSVSFITLNSSKKGIRPSDSSQWAKFKKDLDSISTDNLIITLSSPIFGKNGFTDQMEADVFHKVLEEKHQEGKNIFVLYENNKTLVQLKDGIRYIGINNSPITSKEQVYDISFIEFVVNGSDLTYEIVPMFNRPDVKLK